MDEVESGFGKIKLYEQKQSGDFSSIKNDLTYVDNSLGFQISKPNEKWEFDSNIEGVFGSQISNKKFLGGMYVKKKVTKNHFL